MRNDLTTLGHNRQPAASPPVRGHLRDIFSIKHQVSRTGWQQSGNHFESRRFSHAVPAHQADDFTVRNRERDIAENVAFAVIGDRKSTRLNSSHSQISYAVFCL